jgi:uncharacterized protein YukE
MPASGGFTVDPKALAEVAGTAHEQAERVRGYVRSMRAPQCPSAELLGEYGGVDAAFGRFLNAWAEEFELTANALDESGVKLAESAKAYTHTDKLHTR